MPDTNYKDYIDALSADTKPESTDLIYIRTSAGSRKMTVQDLFKAPSLMAVKGRDGGDIGGYLMDGVNDYVVVTTNDNLNFGTGDFTVELLFVLNALPAAEKWILAKGRGGTSRPGYSFFIASNGKLNVVLQDTATTSDLTIEALTLSANTLYHIVAVFDRDGNLTVYSNGTSVKTADISGRNTAVGDGFWNLTFGSYSSGSDNIAARFFMSRLWNRALSASEVLDAYQNGRPPSYVKKYADRGANNTALTSGTLTIGKRYRLKDFITGDDFTNIGAASNADGVEFIATGTTPTTWTNSSEVVQIGCVAEFMPNNAGRLGWIDSSSNQLSGATSGSPICLNTEARPAHYRDIRKAIAANTDTTLTSIVPRGYKIVSIRAKGSDSLADIKIGTSSGGEQIVASTTTSSTTPKLLTLASTANDAYSESADVTLYARHDTSASGKTMDLIFHFEKIGN